MPEMFDQKIEQHTLIYASPEKVYDTITSAVEWDSFFTTGMKLDPIPGGVCSFAWKEWGPSRYTHAVPGIVVDAVRPDRFVFKWGKPGKESTVSFVLKAREGGTLVICTEEGYPNTPEGRAAIMECACGWGEAVTLLKFYIEHGLTYRAASPD